MIKLVIFDLDGTLINTIADIGNACNHALRECGHPERRAEDYNLLVGRGIYNLFIKALPQDQATESMVIRMKEHFIPYYNTHLFDYTVPYDGIPELLDLLEDNGIRIAVASNKYQEATEILVNKFFGKHKFVKILGQRDGNPIKPDPQIVHEIMDDLPGITEKEIIYCGDSDVDMQTGKNAGVTTVGVTWGFRTREELEANSPSALIDKPSELMTIIDNLK